MRFELCWAGRGYETIYLGNPSEASSEIHLDGALTSYSPPSLLAAVRWKIQRKKCILVEFENIKERLVDQKSYYPQNFLLNFFWVRQCNQCQTDSKKNWFPSNLLSENNVELARYACSIWNIQKIVLRYLPQMSRRPIKSLFHCHQEIVRKESRLNFQHHR